MSRACGWLVVLPCLVILAVAPLRAQEASPPVLFRVFMTDGRVLASYGEWARVDGRVVFSMPTRVGTGPVDLQLVTIPADRVDWIRTDRYANSVRAAAYAASRGENDFAQLGDEVARVLNEVALIVDPGERLATAERARRSLSDWPGAHYGYRAREVRDILGLLDEVIAELRVAAGHTRFDLSFTTALPADPADPLLPSPTETELVDQLVVAASLVETPADRTSLLRTVLKLIDRAVGLLPAAWAGGVRRTALAGLADEERVETAYGALRTSTLMAVSKAADRGDVRGLDDLRKAVRKEDERLGFRRPGDVAGLMATIVVELEAARRFRLARDQWDLRAPGQRTYRRSMASSLSTLKGVTGDLEKVRAMSGPDPSTIGSVAKRLARQEHTLAKIAPPSELAAAHALVRSAWQLTQSAFRLRLEAVKGNSIDSAQQASSAAAGALMLFSRARADLDVVMQKPTRQ